MLDPHFNFSDTDGFVDLLNSPDRWDEGVPAIRLQPAFHTACDKTLLSGTNRIRVLRGLTVWRFYRRIRKCFPAPVKVRVHPFRRGYAYMLDRGEVHILADLLFKASHGEFIAVVLHETAHIALRQCASYGQLLQLDALFAETYFRGQFSGLLKVVTPVEFHTQLLADLWMRQAQARCADARLRASLQKELDTIHGKLCSAVELLNEIKNQTIH